MAQVDVESVQQADPALLVCIENKSSYTLKVTYPEASGFFYQGERVFIRLAQPGNHKIVMGAYTQDKYNKIYEAIATTEIPIFLDGHTIVTVQGKGAGYLIAVTNGMFPDLSAPNNEQKKRRK